MKTVRIDPNRPDPSVIAAAAKIIRDGGLVAFPTETVYGLGANALDEKAIERIFAAKGRPSYNPLIAHCADVDVARSLAARWPDEADRLAAAFWPGPLTIVVSKRPEVPDLVTAGLQTVALRVPSHPVAHGLLAVAGVPIAAPSANRSSELSPTRAEHVVKGLGELVDLVLDAGESSVGIESSVVDLSGPEPTLLRPGTLDAEQLRQVLGRELRGPTAAEQGAARSAPGMLDRHYAPRARLVLLEEGQPDRLDARAAAAEAEGVLVGALLLKQHPSAAIAHPVRMPSDAIAYARRLYGTLHQLDDLGCELVLVESPPHEPRWAGVLDRLTRAAAPE